MLTRSGHLLCHTIYYHFYLWHVFFFQTCWMCSLTKCFKFLEIKKNFISWSDFWLRLDTNCTRIHHGTVRCSITFKMCMVGLQPLIPLFFMMKLLEQFYLKQRYIYIYIHTGTCACLWFHHKKTVLNSTK